MASAGTTQMDTPSLRRVYRSRALRRAMAASGACRLPAWTWERPRLDRTKTSHSGQTLRPLVELAEAVETGYPPVELAETGTSAAELVRTEISSPLVEPEPL